MTAVEFVENQADVAMVRRHLQACDAAFVPRLSDRVDIAVYATKIVGKARRFEAWAEGELLGLVAAYCNASDRMEAFVTSVSVLPHAQGKGIMSLLMERCIAEARRQGFRRIRLEVGTQNAGAIAVYTKQGFTIASDDDDMATMTLEL